MTADLTRSLKFALEHPDHVTRCVNTTGATDLRDFDAWFDGRRCGCGAPVPRQRAVACSDACSRRFRHRRYEQRKQRLERAAARALSPFERFEQHVVKPVTVWDIAAKLGVDSDTARARAAVDIARGRLLGYVAGGTLRVVGAPRPSAGAVASEVKP
jgi:hypothetical protein